MTARKFDHLWTAKGWKRIPHRLTTVKKIAIAKRKTRKRQRGAAATIDEALTFYRARKLAAAKLAADALQASVPKDASRRRLGHYNALQHVQPVNGAFSPVNEKRPAGTFLEPASPSSPWAVIGVPACTAREG